MSLTIHGTETILKMILANDPMSFSEIYNFMVDSGYITNEDDELTFATEFFGGYNREYVRLSDGRFTLKSE